MIHKGNIRELNLTMRERGTQHHGQGKRNNNQKIERLTKGNRTYHVVFLSDEKIDVETFTHGVLLVDASSTSVMAMAVDDFGLIEEEKEAVMRG